MNKMLKHSLSIGFIASAPLAAAETAALHCTTIQDNATRLACYDNIYSAQLPPQSPLPQAQTETAKTPVDLEQSIRKSIEKKEAAIVFDNPTHPNISDDVLSETADSYTP
ncbi:phospholipase A, partial [Neisseria sp. P0017.S006]